MNLINRIEHTAIAELVPYAGNARTHSEDQVAQIAGSIKEFGFNNPVLIDKDNGIIAGHGRVMAAGKLGMDLVPTVTLDHLSDAERRAYILADNRLALNAGWDESILASELQRLESEIDLDLLGFDDDELTALLNSQELEPMTDEDAVPDAPENPVTVEGDVWLLGRHRLMCGDATSVEALNKLVNGKKVDMVYTDPPYGISIVGKNGSVGGGKLAKTGVYSEIAGDNSIEIAVKAIEVLKTLTVDVQIIWGGNYYAQSLANSPCWIIWDKNNTGNFADVELAWTNQKTAAKIFKHTWNGMIKASERGEKRVHPTQKPVALLEWCVDSYGHDCDVVLDVFGGSGSTLIGCESKLKTCFMMELSPSYIDIIIKRWQDYTGQQATHEVSGKTFDEVANVSEEIRASTTA